MLSLLQVFHLINNHLIIDVYLIDNRFSSIEQRLFIDLKSIINQLNIDCQAIVK